MELAARIDQVSEKMSAIVVGDDDQNDNDQHKPCLESNFYFFYKTFKIKLTLLPTTRYDFEANKKNNLIFYGLPSDPRETPNSLVTKVKLESERIQKNQDKVPETNIE